MIPSRIDERLERAEIERRRNSAADRRALAVPANGDNICWIRGQMGLPCIHARPCPEHDA